MFGLENLGSGRQLTAEFLVCVLLFALVLVGPTVVSDLLGVDSGVSTSIVLAVFYMGYQMLSKEGKALLDSWRGTGKNDSGGVGVAAVVILLVIIGVAAGVVYLVYVAHVDIIALLNSYGAVGAMIATFIIAAAAFVKGFFPKKDSGIVGVQFKQVMTGFAITEKAIIDWNVWLAHNGMKAVFIGVTMPLDVIEVDFETGGSAVDVYYQKATNRIYAKKSAPKFQEIVPVEEQKQKDYIALLGSATPVKDVVEKFGKPAKDLLASAVPVGCEDYDRYYTESVEYAIQHNDRKTALDIFCILNDWIVPGPK